MANDVIILRCVLFFYPHTIDLLDIHDGRTVENWEFRTVDLYQTVVHAQSIECRKAVFNGRHAHIAVGQNCSALRVDNTLCQGIDNGLSFQIDSLYLIAGVFGGRIERHREVQSRM